MGKFGRKNILYLFYFNFFKRANKNLRHGVMNEKKFVYNTTKVSQLCYAMRIFSFFR